MRALNYIHRASTRRRLLPITDAPVAYCVIALRMYGSSQETSRIISRLAPIADNRLLTLPNHSILDWAISLLALSGFVMRSLSAPESHLKNQNRRSGGLTGKFPTMRSTKLKKTQRCLVEFLKLARFSSARDLTVPFQSKPS